MNNREKNNQSKIVFNILTECELIHSFCDPSENNNNKSREAFIRKEIKKLKPSQTLVKKALKTPLKNEIDIKSYIDSYLKTIEDLQEIDKKEITNELKNKLKNDLINY